MADTKYYLRNGHPYVETRYYNSAGTVIVGIANEIQPGDVEISEVQYNSEIAALEASKQALVDNYVLIAEEQAIRKASLNLKARGKLLAIGLDNDEVDALLNIYPLPEPD